MSKLLRIITGRNETLTNIGILWLRILLGLGIAYHGYGKVFGGGLEGFAKGVEAMGFPNPEFFAWAAALSEFAGGILIILGLFTRPAALMVFTTMAVAIFIMHAPDPLQKKELALAYWTGSFFLVLAGSGKLGLDVMFSKDK